MTTNYTLTYEQALKMAYSYEQAWNNVGWAENMPRRVSHRRMSHFARAADNIYKRIARL